MPPGAHTHLQTALLDSRRDPGGNRVRTRLAGGGSRIRTLGPPKNGLPFETAFVASLTVPFLPKSDSPSRVRALRFEPHSFCRCSRENHSCNSSLAPSHLLARSNQNDGVGYHASPALSCRSAAASQRHNQTWCVSQEPKLIPRRAPGAASCVNTLNASI
jgi:hypothetical protein